MAVSGAGEESLRLKPDARAQLRSRLPGCVLSTSIIAAPFVGLLYSIDLALGIAVVGLLAVAWLAWQGREAAPPELRGRLRVVSWVNLGLAASAAIVLVLRLT